MRVQIESTPNRIRHEYPTVDYRPSTDNYWVDARTHEYPGKKSGQYMLKDRAKALAKAEEIATLVANLQTVTPWLPSSVIEELQADGLCPYEILNKALLLHKTGAAPSEILTKAIASHQNQSANALLGAAFAQFKEHKLPNMAPVTQTTVLSWLEKWVAATGPKKPIGTITLTDLLKYIEKTQNPDTYNSQRKHLVNFFSTALRYKLVSENIAQGIPRKKRIANVQILTPDEARRLLFGTFTAFQDPSL